MTTYFIKENSYSLQQNLKKVLRSAQRMQKFDLILSQGQDSMLNQRCVPSWSS